MSVNRFSTTINLDSTDSTNNYATARLMKEGWAEGTLVVARVQLMGKGQGKNRWESEAGKNFLGSLVLYPRFLEAQKQFYISKVVALAVFDLVREFVDKVSIKWPNDIYVGKKKIAGILIENALLGKEICWTVAGVGLNVNQKVFYSDAPNPVSLAQLSNSELDIGDIISRFLYFVQVWYDLLASGNYAIIDDAYHSRLYRLGERARYTDSQGDFFGKILGVNALGHLQVEKENGNRCSYNLKEIVFDQ